MGWLEAENSSEVLLQLGGGGLSKPFENTACQSEEVSPSSSRLLCFLSRN